MTTPNVRFDILDEWQTAIAVYPATRRQHLRGCLVGALAARLALLPGGPELFRDAINDALTYGADR